MKRALTACVQAVITCGLLWWVFHDPAKRALMRDALTTANYWWLAPGLAAVGAALLLQTQRWALLLRVQGIDLGWFNTWRLTMIGAFFNLFLLGATGGDVVKMFYAVREAGGRRAAAALLSVVADRIVGILALVAVSAVATSFRLGVLLGTPLTQALVLAMAAVLGGSVVFVAIAFLVSRLKLQDRLPAWMPCRHQISEFALAFGLYASAGRAVLTGFGISIVAHTLLFTAFYFAARAFTAGLTVVDLFSVLPIIQTITALPISFSGIGVREGLFQRTLGDLYAVPAGEAVLISMAGFLLIAFWGIVGGAVYLGYRSKKAPESHLADMRQEVATLEDQIESNK